MKTKVAKYYSENLPLLLSTARVDNYSDAEEVVSEAVITILRQVDTGRLTDEEDIGRFFTTAIHSRSIDFKRSADRHGVVDNEMESGITFDQQFDEGLNPEETLEDEQDRGGMELLIERVVNKNKRDILTKYYLYSWKTKAIAKQVGVSVQYVNRVIKEFGS